MGIPCGDSKEGGSASEKNVCLHTPWEKEQQVREKGQWFYSHLRNVKKLEQTKTAFYNSRAPWGHLVARERKAKRWVGGAEAGGGLHCPWLQRRGGVCP